VRDIGYPGWFLALAVATGIVAILMSAVPVLVYLAMVPVVTSQVLWRFFAERSLPILLVYALALMTAVLLRPAKRQLIGAAILAATIPVAVLLMVHGLR
jgi:hypothetical protein